MVVSTEIKVVLTDGDRFEVSDGPVKKEVSLVLYRPARHPGRFCTVYTHKIFKNGRAASASQPEQMSVTFLPAKVWVAIRDEMNKKYSI